MELTPSAYADSFARDHLPPQELWPTIEFTLPELQFPARLNAASALLDDTIARLGADRPALRTPAGELWTYGELAQRVNQIAHVLTDHFALAPGQRVVLRTPNNPWAVACWFAVLKAGGIVVTTIAALRAGEIVPVLERSQPALAIVDHRFADDLLAARDSWSPDLKIVQFGSGTADDLIALSAEAPTEYAAVDTAADDVALLGPTSGTTGTPKLTMHFHRDLLAIAETFGRHLLQLSPDDVVACTAPLAFTFGLGALVVFPMRAGASTLLTESATPVQLAELVSEHRVSFLATAPTAYRAILVEGKEALLSSVRTALSAGEHLPQTTWQALYERTGLKVIDGIGSTELLHIFISAAGDDIRPGATGRPVPGFRATILDADGAELGPNQPGRLAVIGPTGCRYLNDERQRAYVVNGWNVTGDTFYRDEDGYFYYQSRTDNMIVSSGYNIGGPEVEEAVNRHPDVVESAVVARPDPDRGSVVCAFVVLRPGVAADEAKKRELQDFVKQQIAPYKYPRDVRFVSSLPRNATGKLQHFKLRQDLEDELRQSTTVSPA